MKIQPKKIVNFVQNMGLRYVSFRIKHELLRKTGLLKNKFPVAPPIKQYTTLTDWQQQKQKFFFSDKSEIKVPKTPAREIEETFQNIVGGKLLLFNSLPTLLGADYDWVTNPDSGHKYDTTKHWTEIPDLSKEAGDIKYVWEKSRFSYLYDIIRYDYHFDKDNSEMVFRDIHSWIRHNPINCGPNYRCSQEMSLRALNWIFALHFYKDSKHLTTALFEEIQHTLYWHFHHIYNNINFSRIAVRNNHAITETLMLYLAGIFFPQFPGALAWKTKGKKWFEEEVTYQIYEDGTFLQFSMNYHRVVVQLLTWAIVLSEKNGERFADVVYNRAKRSVGFLRTCMIEENGWLPNYGANDGALFFPLSGTHYRDYRPQIQALAFALGKNVGIDNFAEDAAWYGLSKPDTSARPPHNGTHTFEEGGYYIIREPETLTFIKCGSYKDRPSQADNLHLDIWYKGANILIDAGSYKYNTDDDTIRYFSGTQSHNTVMLNDADQMLKGGRFVWYYWSQRMHATLSQRIDHYFFKGEVAAFKQIENNISHKRIVTKTIGKPEWMVTDIIVNKPNEYKMRQLWHYPTGNQVSISATDVEKREISPEQTEGWNSSLYGQKEQSTTICYSTQSDEIVTLISL